MNSKNSTQPEIPIPDYDEPKEVYAFFGLAAYWAQVFEHSLINLAAGLKSSQITPITNEDFDQIFVTLDKRTCGMLKNIAREIIEIPEDVDNLLDDAVQKRNYLTHHFFKTHAEDFLSEIGKRKMIDELIDIIKLFKNADRKAENLYLPLWKKYGITEELIEKELERVKGRIQSDKT